MDLRETQRPLKERYREEPGEAQITLSARGGSAEEVVACSVDLGRAIQEAQAHPGVGGAGTGACSGDLLLGALAACAQLTCQMVATAMDIPVRDIAVHVDGDLDLRGTLGMDREVDVGFERIRCDVRVKTSSDPERARRFFERAEQFCVVLNTLRKPLAVESSFAVER